jgi:DNA repair exonuclease SbcCD nuclease subunit
VRIAIIGDVHLGCTKYTDKRVSDFAKQFNAAIEGALDRKVNCICLLGDIFDSSAYRRSIDSFANALGTVSQQLVNIKERNIPVFAIAGNHEYGRGREAGEVRILNDLGFLRLLRDETVDYEGFTITGVPWKNDREVLEQTLRKLAPRSPNSILLLHQFCFGSKFIPSFLWEVTDKELSPWRFVFTGHHHQHEVLGKVIAPGSIEIQSPDESSRKGFVIVDTNSGRSEFVPLKKSRDMPYLNLDASGKEVRELEKEITNWIHNNSSPGALLIIRLKGKLRSGRSFDVNWRGLRSLAIQRQCLALVFEGGLEDVIRTASQIRLTVNFSDVIAKRFGPKSQKASDYVEKLRETGDEFGTQLLDEILQEPGRK